MLDGTGPLLCIEVEGPGGPHESGCGGRAVSAGAAVGVEAENAVSPCLSHATPIHPRQSAHVLLSSSTLRSTPILLRYLLQVFRSQNTEDRLVYKIRAWRV